MEFEKYKKKGQTMGSVGAIIGLITGIGVSVMVLIFVGVLAGQTYQMSEANIDAITNTTIRSHVKGSIISGFSALETTGDYLPIIVLAVIIAIVLSLVLGLTAFSGGGRGGSAL
jgi:flagellar biosynthesis protein FlhB